MPRNLMLKKSHNICKKSCRNLVYLGHFWKFINTIIVHTLSSNIFFLYLDTVNKHFREFAKQSQESVQCGDCAVVYAHPENVVSATSSIKQTLLSDVCQKRVVACVVDEAHCIVGWGSRYVNLVYRLDKTIAFTAV